MKIIEVKNTIPYKIIIGTKIISQLNYILKNIIYDKIVIISDNNVWNLYGEFVISNLKSLTNAIFNFNIHPGEQSKNINVINSIYTFLTNIKISKCDCIISLGGGVVGDIAGFVASSFMRGINLIHIPTTLIAQIDSSIGGKNGINLSLGKNLIGTFYNPKFVICDSEFLQSLPNTEISNGMAEVIKYCFISNKHLINIIKLRNNLNEIIYNCIKIKKELIEIDPFDKKERRILNFGHTLGHAIESIGKYNDFSHGQAISLGMLLITKSCVINNITDYSVYKSLFNILSQYNLPTSTNIPLNKILQNLLFDKKRRHEIINFIIVTEIGKSDVLPININDLHRFFSIN